MNMPDFFSVCTCLNYVISHVQVASSKALISLSMTVVFLKNNVCLNRIEECDIL